MSKIKNGLGRLTDGIRVMFLILMGSRERAITEYGLEGVICE